MRSNPPSFSKGGDFLSRNSNIYDERFNRTLMIVNVDKQGQIAIPNIPQIKSSKVEIIILPLQTEDDSDLTNASESSIEFWNNPVGEVWNDV